MSVVEKKELDSDDDTVPGPVDYTVDVDHELGKDVVECPVISPAEIQEDILRRKVMV